MPRPARISLLALGLLVAGCSDSSGPEIFGCDKIARYDITETVNGSIRTSDCSAPQEDGHVDFYQIRQSADGPVSFIVDVPEGSVPLYVGLFRSDEELVDVVQVFPGEEGVVGGLLAEGSYFLAIGSETPGTDANYILSSVREIVLSGPPFQNCTVSESYTILATVLGALESGDCVTPDDGLMDRYQFTLATARTVTITLSSGEFDAFLYLFNSEGGILARNDDASFETLNSRIRVPLPAGTYSIGVTALDGVGEGLYTLRSQ